ncbi:arsenate reductase ArsC [Simiduia sp. 21SJ11W-1]|uniref:arsenate reductase ArsC n=1 Tax=Simiduia sp. 21SJ11W-1 TaxID=2909669 RepID=UPI00209E6E32|nr:arsenate reductase ArsC [Simiduia sp. 21SJ11W-1]UTA47541.1 arsenate reductase ArsC [Simiduia sp. 21SJ11W-1]
MKTLLFVCIHNSARSQMAEAFARQYGAGKVQAFSAGLTPGQLNPVVVAAMAELGVDISHRPCRSVDEHLAQYGAPDVMIAVCDAASAERCPHLPGVEMMHWHFADPSSFTGTLDAKLAATRRVRDAIGARVKAWCESLA